MIGLAEKFAQLKKQGRKAFIVYVPFGFPGVDITKDIILTLEEAGVDIIELGIPFSDPLADGPIIQKATSCALKKGADINNLIQELAQLQDLLKIPLVVMSYYNPIFKFGLEKFFDKMNQVGVSAVTVVDLPLEESRDYIEKAREFGLDTVFFITPTTSDERMQRIVKQSKGFIYYISVTGTTGPKNLKYISLENHVRSIKRIANVPVCVGFGIHKREQVVKINSFSDGVIVGSEIVKFIEEHHEDRDFLKELKNYISSLTGGR